MNKFTAEMFAARLARANLITKTDNKLTKLDKKKLAQIKLNIYLLKMNLKNCRYLIQFILEVSYLENMVLKII